MKSPRSIAALFILSSAFAVGCVGESESVPADPADGVAEAEQALDAEEAPEARPDAERHGERDKKGKRAKRGKKGRGGPMGAFMKGLKNLELSDDQQAELKEIKREMRGDKDGNARGELNQALASAIESGNVSVSALSAELDAVEQSASERVTAMQSALNSVHATLTPEQRIELADSLADRMDEMADKRSRKGDKAKRGKRGKAGKAGIGRFAKKLDLTDAQKEQLKNIEPPTAVDHAEQHEAMRDKMEAAIEAFRTDDFDAAALGIGAEMPTMARAKAERMITNLEQVVPVLDEGQRAELAKMIEKRGKKGKKGKRGKRGKDGKRGKRGSIGLRSLPE